MVTHNHGSTGINFPLEKKKKKFHSEWLIDDYDQVVIYYHTTLLQKFQIPGSN